MIINQIASVVGGGGDGGKIVWRPVNYLDTAGWKRITLQVMFLQSVWISGIIFALPVADNNLKITFKSANGTVIREETGLSVGTVYSELMLSSPLFIDSSTLVFIQFDFSSENRAYYRTTQRTFTTGMFSMPQYTRTNSADATSTIVGSVYFGIIERGTYVPIRPSLHLDGINNSGSGHSGSATFWADLSGNEFGTIKDAGNTIWGDKYLRLDGSTRWRVPSPSFSKGTVELVVSIDEDFVPVNNTAWYNCSCIFGTELSGAQRDWAVLVDKDKKFAVGYANSTIYSSSVIATDGLPHTITYTYDNGPVFLSIDGQYVFGFKTPCAGTEPTLWGIGWNRSNAATTVKGNIYMIKWYNEFPAFSQIQSSHIANKTKYGF